MTRLAALKAAIRRDEGQVSGFAVIMVVAMLAVAGLVLDGGLAVSAKVRAIDIAQGAARAGAQHLDLAEYRRTGLVRLDVAEATAAAQRWLSSASATGTVTATAQQVRVEVTAVANTQLLRIVGVGTITVHANATAIAVRSDTG
jgi:Flp pilus assembly protein TadG